MMKNKTLFCAAACSVLLAACSAKTPDPAYLFSGGESPIIEEQSGNTLIDINLLFSYALQDNWSAPACVQSIWMMAGSGMVQEDLVQALSPDEEGTVDPSILLEVLNQTGFSYSQDSLNPASSSDLDLFTQRIAADLKNNQPVLFSFTDQNGRQITSLITGIVLDENDQPALLKYTNPVYSSQDGNTKTASVSIEELSELLQTETLYFY